MFIILVLKCSMPTDSLLTENTAGADGMALSFGSLDFEGVLNRCQHLVKSQEITKLFIFIFWIQLLIG